MAEAAPGTPSSPPRASAAALLALWAAPALALAALTFLLGPPPADAPADPATAAARLGAFALRMVPELFLIAWFAAPTAQVLAGAPVSRAARVLGQPRVLGVAALLALTLATVLSLTLLPGVLASYVNPLMATIFYVAGVIGGAAGAVQVFRRWMFAPALAAAAAPGGVADALDASAALSRRHRTGGFALGMAVAYALVTLAGAAGFVVAGRVGGPAAAALAAGAVWWLGVPGIAARIGRRAADLPGEAGAGPAAPTLALRHRPSQCPRCGALATVAVAGPTPVVCGGCGLRAEVR